MSLLMLVRDSFTAKVFACRKEFHDNQFLAVKMTHQNINECSDLFNI